MADQEMVKVDMDRTVGLRGADGGAAVLYGPGKGIEVPRKLADGLGLKPSVLAARRTAAADGGADAVDFDEMKVDELEELLRSQGVDPERLKGTGGRSKDQVVKADLVKAAEAKAAGEEPVFVAADADEGTADNSDEGTADTTTDEGGTDATTEENQGGQE